MSENHSISVRQAENGVVVEVSHCPERGPYECKTFVGATKEDAMRAAGATYNETAIATPVARNPLAGAMARTIFSDIGKK